jgi:leucyl aminopeptidase
MNKHISVVHLLSGILFFILLSSSCRKEGIDDFPQGPPDEFVRQFVDELNTDTLEKNVQWLQSYNSRFFLNNNRKQIALDIVKMFIRFGYTDVRIDSFNMTATWNDHDYNTWQYNVIARLEGSAYPENIYVAGAHYDCISETTDPFLSAPGANDNASGVAGILEMARVMKKKGFVPESTIEFVAFAAEEYELNGSEDYADKARSDNLNIVMMLNHDMIANETATDPSDWTLMVMNYLNSAELRTKYVNCGKTYTKLNFSQYNQYNTTGDSYSFYKKGYKALFMLCNSTDQYYHTADDIADHYNFPYCREVTAVSLSFLVQETKL